MPCTLINQYFLNLANLADHILNTLLLGDPNETVSARTARARRAGRRWAVWACKALTLGARIVTFGQVTGDHCDYALNEQVLPNCREIVDWNTGKFLIQPKTIVDDVELPGN